jgi:hypothetical protein
MTYIHIDHFKQAFTLAIACLQQKEMELNDINVFPISDNDTGTNLSLSLNDLVQQQESFEHYASFFSTLSNRVFMQARGNSGMLFSIWLEGMAKKAPAKDTIPTSTLWEIIHQGCQFLYSEVKDIAKGSFVTVIREFSEHLLKERQNTALTEISVEEILQHLEGLVNKTSKENPILMQHHVVDAGALGFAYFMRGLLTSLVNKANKTIDDFKPPPTEQHHHTHSLKTPPNYRYCTEAILGLDKKDEDRAKKLISSYGDCDLFLSKTSVMRFHLHCDHPAQLFKALADFSTITSPKIEDMLRQYQASNTVKKIALITDTSADLSEALLEQYQIHRIPATIIQGKNEWLDGDGLDPTLLYKDLEKLKPYPTTATPTLGRIKILFDFLKQHYNELLVITVSSKLSGTFNAIDQVSKNDKHIHLIDSKKNSGAHGLLVTYAGTLIEENKPIDEIKKQVESMREKMNIFVSVANFKAMVRSGRMSPLKGMLAKITQIKPLISLSQSGKGIVVSKSLSIKRSRKKLIQLIKDKHKESPIEQYTLMHVEAKDEAIMISKQLEHFLKKPPLFIKTVSPAIGLHAGIGAIAIAIHQKEHS